MTSVSQILKTTLEVSEVFGPTVQGEGPWTGRICMFVRLYGCNLQCTYCDTPYTWVNTRSKAVRHRDHKVYTKDEHCKVQPIHGIMNDLTNLWPAPCNVVISGGEPFMQRDLTSLLQVLVESGYTPAIETAGTIEPTPTQLALLDTIVVSPKLASSGNSVMARRKLPVLAKFAERSKTWFKFVVKDTYDLEEIDRIVFESGIARDHVMLMAEGISPEKVIEGSRAIVNHALDRGYGLSPRWHTILWKDERGK